MAIPGLVLIAEPQLMLHDLWASQLNALGLAWELVDPVKTLTNSQISEAQWLLLDSSFGLEQVPAWLRTYPSLHVIVMSWDNEIQAFLPSHDRLTFLNKSSLKDRAALTQIFSHTTTSPL
ncbi:hypothetical protein [Sulfobacillus thermosulfidooxidans]|uniref:hypothetical protein n=1 Tax=Sulfobacillus thermosulfidooxidans TaxID=28034 RepID=UPI00096BC7FB|nr:hypothetical protein [Sulfobacillus thermosulfidooxidans]OLZ12028.1 hypothetical protein BFX05_06030 [Sulfobacillus thermosulfidooxidans]OLZ16720.1 hypothetical protein BFX06_14565 [Sulfobacillus thermosulfidooxidans]OLZ20731.1 hypothetical protein BFX07_14715 [Sulfobacillus thermosulfidooxidans]